MRVKTELGKRQSPGKLSYLREGMERVREPKGSHRSLGHRGSRRKPLLFLNQTPLYVILNMPYYCYLSVSLLDYMVPDSRTHTASLT